MDSDIARRLNAYEARLSVIEQKLGISRAAGVQLADGSFAPEPSVNQVQAGKLLQAIAAYRSESGCDLDQAREVLEGIAPR
jgi:hypothetical protein